MLIITHSSLQQYKLPSLTNNEFCFLTFQDILYSFKNGVITRFSIEVGDANNKTDHLQTRFNVSGQTFNTNLTLECDVTYTIDVRGATSVGPSARVSSIVVNTSGKCLTVSNKYATQRGN